VANRLGSNESTFRQRFEALRRQGCVNVATFVQPTAIERRDGAFRWTARFVPQENPELRRRHR
jgi:hypothetical protein